VELIFQIALEDVFQTCGDYCCIASENLARKTIPAGASTEATQKDRNRPLPGAFRAKKRPETVPDFWPSLVVAKEH
jgi:hypothetical protein